MAYAGKSGKRKLYVSDCESSSNDMDYLSNNKYKKSYSKENKSGSPTFNYSLDDTGNEKPKCNTRNALMARRNRIKKKMYMQRLEMEISKLKENKAKLNLIVSNQSHKISNLQKELKYMKSLLLNSSDISNLIRNIRDSTGMSVKACLGKTLNKDCVSKHNELEVHHPWENKNLEIDCQEFTVNTSTSECNDDMQSYVDKFPLDLDLPPLIFDFDGVDEVAPSHESYKSSLKEHNYSTSIICDSENSDDVGVCLHVAKHKVSLEFCSSCSENAIEAWQEDWDK